MGRQTCNLDGTEVIKNGEFNEKSPIKNDSENEEKKEEESEFPSVSHFSLFRYASGQDKLCILIGLICCIGQGVIQPLYMLVFGNLTEDIIIYFTTSFNPMELNAAKEKFKEDVLTYILHNCLLGVGMLIFSYGACLTFNYSGIRQTFRIRKMFLEKALNQDISWYDVHKTGDFASRMSDDLAKLEDGIGEKVALVLFFQVAFVACLVQALIIGWELTLICLVSLPVTMIALGTVAWITSKLAKNELEAYGAAGNIAEEVISTIRTVFAFGGQDKEMSRYNEHVKFAQNNNIKRSFMNGLGFGLLWLFTYASYALSFWYGVGLVLAERVENIPPEEQTYGPGNMATVFFSVMTASMYFGMSFPYIEAFSIATGAGSKIFGVISSEPTINLSKNKGVELKKLQGTITMTNVKFRYPARNEVEVLKGLSLKIKAGDTVALVGSSGCGKSTCIQLVQRFYDPEEGEVLIDDVNIKDLKLSWLREKIGLVEQEPVLFDATIAENIRYGNMDASMEDITKAAIKANAHRFVSKLPNGYDTIVGERGAQLSGGQKQRIAIARALVRKPTILLLDEATSALDTNSEAIVQKALDNASSECTTIIIAHRLSTIRGANRILVIHEGVIVEEGTHDDLMSKEGDYYRLVMAQVNADQQGHSGDQNADEVIIDELEVELEEVNVKHKKRMTILKKTDKTELKGVLKRVMRLNSNEWKEITIACLASVATGCAMPVFAILIGEILGVLSHPDNDHVRSVANLNCIYFAVTGVVVGTATFLQVFLFGVAGEKLTMRIRTDSFATMLRQEIGWYDMKENGVGTLCAKLSGEAARVQGATGQRVGTIVQTLSTLILALTLSMYYEWKLGLVTLAFTPIILVALYYQEKFMRRESVGYQGSLERSTKLAVEAVSNIRTVVSLGREELFYNMYVTDLEPYTKLAKKSAYVRGAVLGISQSIIFFAMAVCMYYGSYLIMEENVHFEIVFKVSQVLIMGTMSIAQGFAFAPNFEKGLIAAAKVFELMDRLPRIRNAQQAVKGLWKTNDIVYDRITFAYPTRNDIQVLRGLDLSILTGKTVALVGPSGCGKSTIIQLLERYYDPIIGGVSIEGVDLKYIKQSDLRYNLGIVSQEPNLFDRTITENIAYGSNDRTVPMAEIIQAAKNANIHDYISKLPQGYDTKLGPKGTQLSGGQKQRVAIARALIRNPKILLLDEATSALDTESEKVVRKALDNARTGRTCITIAHRLSTIQDADMICVINEGVLHESGTHSQLLQKKGLYYKLHSLQSRRH